MDEKYKNLFYSYDGENLYEEMEWLANKMIDSYTDELFDIDGLDKIVFGTSRLLCDVERYRDDKDEIMAKRGMGVCYTKDYNLNY